MVIYNQSHRLQNNEDQHRDCKDPRLCWKRKKKQDKELVILNQLISFYAPPTQVHWPEERRSSTHKYMLTWKPGRCALARETLEALQLPSLWNITQCTPQREPTPLVFRHLHGTLAQLEWSTKMITLFIVSGIDEETLMSQMVPSTNRQRYICRN